MAERVQDEDGRPRLRFGNHDIRLSLEASIKYLDQYEKFVLVSGDSDFSDLFAHLKSCGKGTELWSFTGNISPNYLQSVDRVDLLGSDMLQAGDG